MKTLGNIIWVLFGGFAMAMEYFVSSILLMVTIIGIPFGIQTLKLGLLALYRSAVMWWTNRGVAAALNLFMNVLWIFLGGFVIFLSHLLGLIILYHHHRNPIRKPAFQTGLHIALVPFGKEIVYGQSASEVSYRFSTITA